VVFSSAVTFSSVTTNTGAVTLSGNLDVNGGTNATTAASNNVALIRATGGEGRDAVLELRADDSDDAEDDWIFESEATGNDLSILNGAVEVINVTTTGNLSIDGAFVAVSSVTATGNVSTLGNFTGDNDTAITGVSNITLAGAALLTGAGSVVTNVNIYGSPIGAVVPAYGGFTTTTNTGNVVSLGNFVGDNDTAISGVSNITLAGAAMVVGAGSVVTNVTIYGSPIGAVVPSTAAFTTMSASGDITANGNITGDNDTAITGVSNITLAGAAIVDFGGSVVSNASEYWSGANQGLTVVITNVSTLSTNILTYTDGLLTGTSLDP
jgi:hypothetical protein